MTSKIPEWHKKPEHIRNLDDALEDVQVCLPGDWFAVSAGDFGIIAYFASERDALSFRLNLINRWFNG